jgi:hypothetical protein
VSIIQISQQQTPSHQTALPTVQSTVPTNRSSNYHLIYQSVQAIKRPDSAHPNDQLINSSTNHPTIQNALHHPLPHILDNTHISPTTSQHNRTINHHSLKHNRSNLPRPYKSSQQQQQQQPAKNPQKHQPTKAHPQQQPHTTQPSTSPSQPINPHSRHQPQH